MAMDYAARDAAEQALRFSRRANRMQRLISSAHAAEKRNPMILPAWLAPAAYADATAYGVGEVVSNAGRWYMCGVAGTAPAGGAPTQVDTAQYMRAVASGPYWTYLSGAQNVDPGDGAPTVNLVSSNPNLGINWHPVTYPSAFRVRGAAPTVHRSTMWSLVAFQAKAGTPMCCGASVSFQSDESKLAIMLPASGQQYRLLIDGRYVRPGSWVVSGGDSWLIVDWTATSGRRLRTYEVETGKSASYFGHVQTSTTATVSASRVDEPRMVVLSDSYNAGSSYGPWLAGGSIAQLLAKRLGWRDAWNLSVGGTGYINPGPGSFYTYLERVPQVLALNPDAILIMGSTNDIDHTPANVTAAVSQTLRRLRAGTTAPIIVAGMAPLNSANVVPTEAAIALAVAQFGDPHAFFIPIATDTMPWLLGPWNNSTAPSNTAGVVRVKNDALYLAGDNTHPPEIGFDYYAQRIEQAVRSSILPTLLS